MDFHIKANNAEDADKEMNKVIERIWSKALKDFACAQKEEDKKDIVSKTMQKGCIPHYLNCKNEADVYKMMKQLTEPKEVSRKQVASISTFLTLQNG